MVRSELFGVPVTSARIAVRIVNASSECMNRFLDLIHDLMLLRDFSFVNSRFVCLALFSPRIAWLLVALLDEDLFLLERNGNDPSYRFNISRPLRFALLRYLC